MLILLPESKRKTAQGVAYVAALPLIVPAGTVVEAVEIRGDGFTFSLVELDVEECNAIGGTVREASRLASQPIRAMATDLDRYTRRPKVSLEDALREARKLRDARRESERFALARAAEESRSHPIMGDSEADDAAWSLIVD